MTLRGFQDPEGGSCQGGGCSGVGLPAPPHFYRVPKAPIIWEHEEGGGSGFWTPTQGGVFQAASNCKTSWHPTDTSDPPQAIEQEGFRTWGDPGCRAFFLQKNLINFPCGPLGVFFWVVWFCGKACFWETFLFVGGNEAG